MRCEYGGHLYGTGASELDAILAGGLDVLLEIEVQGAGQIRERRADARLVFLLPPSREELERRLRGRGTDAPSEVKRRLEVVVSELRAVHDFDYAVVNDRLEVAVTSVCEIIHAERSGNTASAKERFGTPMMVSRLAGRLDFGA